MPPEVVAMALSGRTLYSNQRLASILPLVDTIGKASEGLKQE